MKKLVIFDLDGVLVDAKQIHFEALNFALPSDYKIGEDEHLSLYDGLKTQDKLHLLSDRKNLPEELHTSIFDKKQEKTQELLLSRLSANRDICELFAWLKRQGIFIAVCSNSVRRTVYIALELIEVVKYCDVILANQDVANPKPHPEIFWRAMCATGVTPDETLIVEDSPPGIRAAQSSGGSVFRVNGPEDLKLESFAHKLRRTRGQSTRWSNSKMNVLIPMAGLGTRFTNAGYTFPKPLIEVLGKPMIQLVVENINVDARFIFVVQREHREMYNLDSMLNLIAPDCEIIETENVTQGAACTALLAAHLIDSDDPLFFANSDQYVEWDPADFFYFMQEKNVDGGIATFTATHPKWSFAKINDAGLVTEVAEKNPISSDATVGFYYWKRGSDFVKYARQMINKDIRVNGEFYVCPVFNEAIDDGKVVRSFAVENMWGLGTPEDLESFIAGKSK